MSGFTFGAERQGDGATLFRLWAPSSPAPPRLVLADNSELPMQAEAGGWFACRAPVPVGGRYRYRVGDLLVPDPASRAQSGDVHGWSVVVDPKGFRWRHPDWKGRPWHEAVLYETHAGLQGGFAGLMDDLPRLRDLGITAVQLMPIADFPGGRNWGYDGVLPFAPDEAYGTPDDLKRLVDAAHGEGLMIFLDVVYNHFGPDGNYLHAYAAPFFDAAKHTPWGAAIDFTVPEVRRFFIENAIWWVNEYRFDGLRFDAVHAITAVPGGRDFLREMALAIRADVDAGRHVHLVLEHDDNEAHLLDDGLYDAQWNDDAHHCLHVLLTGEGDGYYADYADAPAACLARCLAQGFAYQGEASPHRDTTRRGEPSAHLPPIRFVNFLQNHDQIGNRALGDRLTALAHPDALRAAMALLLLSPPIPMLFMGEEWGSAAPFLYFTAHQGDLARAVRDGRRAEFGRFAAFAGLDPASIPDPNDETTFRSSIPADLGPAAFCQGLLGLRRDEIVPGLRGARALAGDAIGPAAVRVAWRLGDGTLLTLLCNLGPDPVPVPPQGDAPVLFAVPADAAPAVAGGTLPGRATVWHLHVG